MTAAVAQFPRCEPPSRLTLPSFTALVALKQNMSWHDPDLYFFLCVLTGLAALLAIIYEFRRRKWPVHLKNAPPLDGLNESGLWSKPMTGVADLALSASMPNSGQAGKQEAEQFSQLCESTNDLPPKEQASRVREHFGISEECGPTVATKVTRRCT